LKDEGDVIKYELVMEGVRVNDNRKRDQAYCLKERLGVMLVNGGIYGERG